MSRAYYNEINPYAAAWLRNLIDAGQIAPGDVDTRSIEDVRPTDLLGYTQCHFFAGIGIWSASLRAAGWPDARPVWTGSCPCQPFSTAGKGDGFADERHLWPAWFHLVRVCRPPAVFGEQVANGDGLTWIDLVHVDLEGEGYAVGATDLCAAGWGAPHIRQRLYFVAHPQRECVWGEHREGTKPTSIVEGEAWKRKWSRVDAGPGSTTGLVAHPHGDELRGGGGRDGYHREAGEAGGEARLWSGADLRHGGEALNVGNPASSGIGAGSRNPQQGKERRNELANAGCDGQLVHTERTGLEGFTGNGDDRDEPGRFDAASNRSTSSPSPTCGFWAACDWIPCRHPSKPGEVEWRPVEPGTFPLVDGSAFRLGSGSTLEGKSRQGMLHGYGNGIVKPVAEGFIRCAMEVIT